MTKSLFISYDGMTDPLGQSQIIPYIEGLSANGYEFTLLSAEKEERFKQRENEIRKQLSKNNINWIPLKFTTFPPFLSKFYDVYKMKKKAEELYLLHKFELIHCRSYIAIEIGVYLKKKYGVTVLFDMRGFWVDERVDGGMWDLKNPLFKLAYNYYKKKEAYFINNSDCIISLTEAGKDEIKSWKSYNQCNINVIPCCADFDHFTLRTKQEYMESRNHFGYDDNDFVVSYLGSLGTWYLLDEMLLFFQKLKIKNKNAKFLFITKEPKSLVFDALEKYNISKEDVIVTEATRDEVPFFTKSSDINISFIKPAYSKIASSPTKLGEVLAMGIPVICNHIGDVKSIVKQTGGGICLDECTVDAYEKAINEIDNLVNIDAQMIRKKAYEYYDLKRANQLYLDTYKELLN